MEMEMEVVDLQARDELGVALDRLAAAAALLEQAAERLGEVELNAAGARETQLAIQLAEAQSALAILRAEAAKPSTGRRTTVTGPGLGLLAAKDGSGSDASTGALDASLRSLSIEQRIAVKAEMLRSGLLG